LEEQHRAQFAAGMKPSLGLVVDVSRAISARWMGVHPHEETSWDNSHLMK
jgi:hypothetical protein